MVGYTNETDPDTTARALGKELPISPKKAREVCHSLRGMNSFDALDFLDDVMEKKKAVKYGRYNKRVAHKKGIGPGGYPVKVSEAIYSVIEQAQANAEYKGLDTDSLKIITIAAHRGPITKGQRPRAQGRSTPFNQETVHIEVILEAKEE